MDYLGGGDVEALHTPNRGVEAGLLSLHHHGLLRWLLKLPKISRNFLTGSWISFSQRKYVSPSSIVWCLGKVVSDWRKSVRFGFRS